LPRPGAACYRPGVITGNVTSSRRHRHDGRGERRVVALG